MLFSRTKARTHADPDIRLLTAEDSDAFRALRLRAVREVPEAFLEAYEELAQQPAEHFRRYFEEGWIAGAFVDGALKGITGLHRHRGLRVRHKGTVWGVYVAPEARGRGVGRRLIDMAVTQAEHAGIELVQLSTDASNAATIGLYRSLGFTPYGTEKHILKLDGRYVDDVLMVRFLKEEMA